MLESLDEGCSITRIPIPDGDEHKRRLYRVAVPRAPGVYQPVVHYDCIHNQIRAVHNRVCGVVPKPTREGVAVLRKFAEEIGRTLPPTCAEDIYALAKRHTGAKARRYRDAADAYCVEGLFPRDSHIKMFVKPERMDPSAKVDPDPRAIQFRGAKYCVVLASFLRPIEELLYQYDRASDGVPCSRNVAKGLNAVDRAELLHRKMQGFRSPVVFSCDASRFDKHVDVALLDLEHLVYKKSNNDAMFAKLLSLQKTNKCFSSLGMAYKVRGRRMSGDMNTAIGNVVLMLIMITAYCRGIIELTTWDCLDDGDDLIVIVESEDAPRFQGCFVSSFLTFGMEMKLDAPVASIHQVVFCQSCVVEYAPERYKFVRDFRAVVSKSTSGVRNWAVPKFRTRVIHAVGLCELVLNLGVPVLQSYALCLLRNSKGDNDPLRHAPDGLRARAMRDAKYIGIKDVSATRPVEVQMCARESFAIAFNCDIVEQHRLEQFFDQWVFDLNVVEDYGQEIHAPSWTKAMSTCEVYPFLE